MELPSPDVLAALTSTAAAADGGLLPTPPDTFTGQVAGGIAWAIFMAVAGCYGLWRLLSEQKRAEKLPPAEKLTVGAIELINTTALREDIAALRDQLRVMIDRGDHRDNQLSGIAEKIDRMLLKLEHLETEQLAQRRADEIVASRLADRDRDRSRL